MTKRYYTRAAAEKVLGLSYSRIRQLIQGGRLVAEKVAGPTGPEWHIDAESLEKYRDTQAGRVAAGGGSSAGSSATTSEEKDRLIKENDGYI